MLYCKRGLRALLLLEEGLCIEGCGFGSPGTRVGEIVFSTAMVGYTESLTDPSYRGQILVLTHPLVGNYGVPDPRIGVDGIPSNYESDRIQVEALVVAYETEPSHWTSISSLHDWLKREGVPGVSNVDTRMLVKRLREKGLMMAVVSVYREGEEPDKEELKELLRKSRRYDEIRFVDSVIPQKPLVHEPNRGCRATVVLVDCGVKYGILRELVKRGVKVVRVPCTHDPTRYIEEYSAIGAVVSNGPGNPHILTDVIENVKALVEYKMPTLGICLGHQLLAISVGASVFKLRYGHRGINKPVSDISTGRCYITTQNHSYAINESSLDGTGFRIRMVNTDDKTVEGLVHEKLQIVTVQFHPEASPGPLDTTWIFDYFLKRAERNGGS
uniref:Carbamoyl phosphate synthase small chain n=1 Tax=Fervidicoccus fontis TaxID=683846 RepID=A0A7J3ZJG0_9CREN